MARRDINAEHVAHHNQQKRMLGAHAQGLVAAARSKGVHGGHTLDPQTEDPTGADPKYKDQTTQRPQSIPTRPVAKPGLPQQRF